MPMIAFIGVRISWLIAARNVDLAWFASSAAWRAASASSKNRAFSTAIVAWRAMLSKNARSASVNGRVAPMRQTAAMPITVSRASMRRDHQPLVVVRVLGARDRTVRGSPLGR